MRPTKPRTWFTRFAKRTATLTGRPAAFLAAVIVIAVWAVTGPLFGFSDTWQLVINTGTTIVTFLMVFLIQSTQNRDGRALHLKLDELIRAVGGARNRLVELEKLSEDELDRLADEFAALHQQACDTARRKAETRSEASARRASERS